MVYKISFFVSFFLLIWWFRVTVFLFLPRRFTLSSSLYSPYVWRRPHSDRIQSPFIPLFSYYIYWIMHQIELWFLVSLFFVSRHKFALNPTYFSYHASICPIYVFIGSITTYFTPIISTYSIETGFAVYNVCNCCLLSFELYLNLLSSNVLESISLFNTI